MLERQIDQKFHQLVQKNILHFMKDFNRISCKDEAYLLNSVPCRFIKNTLPTSWQLLSNFVRDEQLKIDILNHIQWLYFTPQTLIGN